MRSIRPFVAGLSAVAVSMVPVVAATAQSGAPADLLPGVTLQTEAVEPGVLRVVSDGIRDLSRTVIGHPDFEPAANNLVTGLDGSVWVFGPDEFYRLGDAARFAAGPEAPNHLGRKAEVAPDGTLWTLVGSTLHSFGDGTWTARNTAVDGFHMQPDGTLWVSTEDGLVRIGAEGTAPLGIATGAADFWVSPIVHDFFAQSYEASGDAEIEVLVLDDPRAPAVRARFDDRPECPGCDLSMSLWESGGGGGTGPAGVLPVELGYADMGDRGDYWIYQHVDLPLAGAGFADTAPDTRTLPFLVHVAGGPTTVYTEADGVPAMGNFDGGYGLLRAAPDGSVWMTPRVDPSEAGACDGLANFDGASWTRYLRGTCTYGFDVAPDGTVWVLAGKWDQATEPGPIDTYVIPPHVPGVVTTKDARPT